MEKPLKREREKERGSERERERSAVLHSKGGGGIFSTKEENRPSEIFLLRKRFVDN